jgi:hypothetical protein
MIFLLFLIWCILGEAGYIFWWEKDFKNNSWWKNPTAYMVWFIGPFSFLAGYFIHKPFD